MRNCAEIFHTIYVNVCSLILLHSFAKIYEIGNCKILFLCLKTELSHGLLPDIDLLKKPKRFWNYPKINISSKINRSSSKINRSSKCSSIDYN